MFFYPIGKKWSCKQHIRVVIDAKQGFKTRRNSEYIYTVIEEYKDKAKRHLSGLPSIVKYLEEEGYLKYISKEELDALR